MLVLASFLEPVFTDEQYITDEAADAWCANNATSGKARSSFMVQVRFGSRVSSGKATSMVPMTDDPRPTQRPEGKIQDGHDHPVGLS